MQNTIELDGRNMQTAPQAHAYLKEILSLPEYYGGNADALHDCLTERSGETTLLLQNAQHVHPRILTVLRDTADENPQLTLPEVL